MLDERKIKLMAKLALYEKNMGKKDFKMCEYYRKDYIGIHALWSFVWVTVGYACIAALAILAGMDQILADFSTDAMLMLVGAAGVGYLATLGLYIIITYIVFGSRHKAAKRRAIEYNHNLIKLLRLYDKEKSR